MGQSETGFFLLLKCLYDGITQYEEIADIFDKNVGTDALKRLSRLEGRFQMENLEPIFYFNEDSIELNNLYRKTVEMLGDENESFDYLKKTSHAYKRIKTKQIASDYAGLCNRSPHANGDLYHEIKLKDKPFERYWKSIKINSKGEIVLEVIFKKYKNKDFLSKLDDVLNDLKGDNRGELVLSDDDKKYFYKMEFFVNTDDDQEQQSLCKEYYEKFDAIVEAI